MASTLPPRHAANTDQRPTKGPGPRQLALPSTTQRGPSTARPQSNASHRQPTRPRPPNTTTTSITTQLPPMHGLRTAQPDQGSHTGFPAHNPGPAQDEDRTLASPSPTSLRGGSHHQARSGRRPKTLLPRTLGPHPRQTQRPQRPDQLLELSLRRFSTTTLTTYMRCLVSFLDFLAAGGRALADLTLAELTDYLFAVQTGQEEDRSSNQTCPRTMLKALSWLQKVAQLEPLRPLLHNPVVLAFHSDSKPTDRREAMPLPLAVIAAWEAQVCNPSCSESLRLFLGGLLLATHSSLRFGDLQRVIPESLSLAQDSLRGSCWSTKTSTQDNPSPLRSTASQAATSKAPGPSTGSRPLPHASPAQSRPSAKTMSRTSSCPPSALRSRPAVQRTTPIQPRPGKHPLGRPNPVAALAMPHTQRGQQHHVTQSQGNLPRRRPPIAPPRRGPQGPRPP